MKFRIISILSLASILFSACQNELEQALTFDVSVAPADNVQIADSIVTAPKGTTLKFNFTGEPDYISFSYNRFNSTKSILTFGTQAAWGTHVPNTLSVFLFETADTLLLNNPKQDSATIVNRQWTDITSQCNLPVVTNVTNKASISLNDYRGKKVCIAFRYKTDVATDWQPTWTISNLQINDTLINTTTKTKTVVAATMGFKPFDMLNIANPYNSAASAGVWNIATPASIVMTRTASGGTLNTDWLISRPIEIAKGISTLSVNPTVTSSSVIPVKNTTIRVNSYSYQFTSAGEYTVTFFASNANYMRQLTTERKIKVIITE
jgi:Domain of unknown function (DUF5017)